MEAQAGFEEGALPPGVLAGDGRLVERLAQPELLALGSRIRVRLTLEPMSREELLAHLKHLLATAANASLMTPPLLDTLGEHALGNLRVLANLGAELLAVAARRELPQLDEKLYLEVYAVPRRRSPSPGLGRSAMHLDPWLLPDDWTPDQAFAVAEFLIALHDAIWDSYGWAIRDELSDSPLSVPSTQLELPLQDTGEPHFRRSASRPEVDAPRPRLLEATTRRPLPLLLPSKSVKTPP